MARGRRGADFPSGFQLLASDALIPFEELFQRAAMIEMIEERLRRDSGSFENQSPTHHFRVLREWCPNPIVSTC